MGPAIEVRGPASGGATAESVIRTTNLTKRYGRRVGVAGLNLEVRPGEIYGFLGPNGAGKTTTIRVLFDFLRPDEGQAAVLGLDTRRHSLEIRRRVGYLAGEVAFWPHLTGRATLAYLDSLRGPRRAGRAGNGRAGELADLLELDLARPVRAYSRGMKQKLGLVAALSHAPDLAILDEPTLGLDPLAQLVVYRLLQTERDRGRTIFFSSHNLLEVQRLCDRVAILRQGRLVAVHDVDELAALRVRRFEAVFSGAAPADLGVAGVDTVAIEHHRATYLVHGEVGAFIRALAAHPVVDLASHEFSLEEVFLRYYRNGAGDQAGEKP